MKRCPFCAEEIQDAAIVCKHCQRDLPAPLPSPHVATVKNHNRLTGWALVVAIVGIWIACMGYVTWGTPKHQRDKFNDFDRKDIAQGFTKAGMPQPISLEADGTSLIATFEVTPREMGYSAQAFGEKAVLILRNAMYPKDTFDFYRVTVNGPSPGPGLVSRYGSARFSEGGSVSWDGK